MTIILKSSGLATRSLGNINGIDPQDWSAFLDFELGAYRVDSGSGKESVSLNDVIHCERPASAEYTDRLGRVQRAGINVPRIHYLMDQGRAGLLTEQSRNGFVSHTDAPATQTITLPSPVNNYIVKVDGGAGDSVDVSGDIEQAITVNAGEHAVITTVGNAEGNAVTLTVSGAPSYMQVTQLRAGCLLTDVHNPGTGTVSQPADRMTLTTAAFNAIYSGGDMTVAMQSVSMPYAGGLGYPLVTAVKSELLLANAADHGVYAAATKSETINRHGARFKASAAGAETLDNINAGSDRRVSTFAVGFSGTLMRHAFAGVVNDVALDTTPQPTRLEIGSANNWVVNENNAVVTKLVIFNRLLAADEMAAISQAWSI